MNWLRHANLFPHPAGSGRLDFGAVVSALASVWLPVVFPAVRAGLVFHLGTDDKVGGTAQYAEPFPWLSVYHNGSNPLSWGSVDGTKNFQFCFQS